MAGFRPQRKGGPKGPNNNKARSNRAVEGDSKNQSNAAALRALLELTPNAMQRVASSPLLGGRVRNDAPPGVGPISAGCVSGEGTDSSSFGGGPQDWFRDEDLEDLLTGELDDNTCESIVRDVLDSLQNRFEDAKTKKQGAALKQFLATIAEHKIYRRAMLVDVGWRLESTLYGVLSVYCKGRGARVGSSPADAVIAARCILFLLMTQPTSVLQSSVGSNFFEQLEESVIDTLPRSDPSRSPDSKLSSAPILVLYSFHILGELIRQHLIGENIPDSRLDFVYGGDFSHSSSGYHGTWADYLRLLVDRFSKRKNNQLKSRRKNDDQTLPWSADDVIFLEGISHVWLALLIAYPSLASALPDCAGSSQVPYAAVWTLIDNMTNLLFGSTSSLLNAYATHLPAEYLKARSGRILVAYPLLVGLTYSKVWTCSTKYYRPEKEGTTLSAHDEMVLKIVEELAFPRSATAKSLPKEFFILMRQLLGTIENGGGFEKQVSIEVGKSDIQDTLAAYAAQFECIAARDLVGSTIMVDSWTAIFVESMCRHYGGTHSTLAFLIKAQESPGMNVIYNNTMSPENRSADRKIREISRSGERNRKNLRHHNDFDDD